MPGGRRRSPISWLTFPKWLIVGIFWAFRLPNNGRFVRNGTRGSQPFIWFINRNLQPIDGRQIN
jgi:hypothetical protein